MQRFGVRLVFRFVAAVYIILFRQGDELIRAMFALQRTDESSRGTRRMKPAMIALVISAMVAVAVVTALRADVQAHDPVATAVPTAVVQGCASLTAEDWVPYLANGDHIDEFDPSIVIPRGYIKIDVARLLVWFAGEHHGRPGFTQCDPPVAPTPTPAPAPVETAPMATSTPEPVKLDLVGCRWTELFLHTFSSTVSPDYGVCIASNGILEYQDAFGRVYQTNNP